MRPDVLGGERQRTVHAFPGDDSTIVIEAGAGTYDAQNLPQTHPTEVDPVEVDP